jgi:ankyrin repeat protein
VQFLVALGADIDATNKVGETALVDVALLGNREIAETLLKHGADPNARSATYDNVLGAAIQSGNRELVELLRSFGARAI